MASVPAPRSIARQTFSDGVRVQLLEGDMDDVDNRVDTILKGQQRLMWWAMGMVASLMTTSILLLVNLVK